MPVYDTYIQSISVRCCSFANTEAKKSRSLNMCLICLLQSVSVYFCSKSLLRRTAQTRHSQRFLASRGAGSGFRSISLLRQLFSSAMDPPTWLHHPKYTERSNNGRSTSRGVSHVHFQNFKYSYSPKRRDDALPRHTTTPSCLPLIKFPLLSHRSSL